MALALEEADVSHGDVAGDLLHPRLIGVGRDASDVDLSGGDFDEEEDVDGDEARGGENLGGKEVAGGDDVLVGLDEVGPGESGLAAVRGRYAMPLEDVADGLVADFVAEVAQSAHDAVITPGGVLSGELEDEFFDLRSDGWATLVSFGGVRAVELLGDEPSIPAQDRLGFDDGADVLERLAAQLLAQLGEANPLRIREVDATRDLGAEDLVLGSQVLVAQQEFGVDVATDDGECFFGFHDFAYFVYFVNFE